MYAALVRERGRPCPKPCSLPSHCFVTPARTSLTCNTALFMMGLLLLKEVETLYLA
jgi:hypothetical protein